jgi:RimJ/RimL family protein N-acetyltransferase
MTPVLLTERLLLRPFEHEDAGALATVMNDPQVARGVCAAPVPFTPLHGAARILMMRAAEARGDLAWAVEQADGTLAGLVTLTQGGGTHELGIAIASPLWGQGLGREALSAVLSWLDRANPAARITVEVFADTPAALRLLEGLGFVRLGTSSRFSLARGRSDAVAVFGRAAA